MHQIQCFLYKDGLLCIRCSWKVYGSSVMMFLVVSEQIWFYNVNFIKDSTKIELSRHTEGRTIILHI